MENHENHKNQKTTSENLKNHEINPRELSSAILGLDGVFNEANKTLNSSKTRIHVKVKTRKILIFV